jgi:hypothetical protein
VISLGLFPSAAGFDDFRRSGPCLPPSDARIQQALESCPPIDRRLAHEERKLTGKRCFGEGVIELGRRLFGFPVGPREFPKVSIAHSSSKNGGSKALGMRKVREGIGVAVKDWQKG